MTIGDEKVVAWLTEWKSPECGTVYRGAYVELANARNVQAICGDSITPLIPQSAYAELAAERDRLQAENDVLFAKAQQYQDGMVAQAEGWETAESQLAELRGALKGLRRYYPAIHDFKDDRSPIGSTVENPSGTLVRYDDMVRALAAADGGGE